MIKIILLLILLIYLNIFGQSDSIPSGNVSQTEEKIYGERLQLSVGWFLPTIRSSAQLNSSGGRIGTTINIEATFKLPQTRQLFRYDAFYRFNNSSSADLYYYELNRSGSTVARDSLVFGENIISVGANLESYFNLSLFGLRYHYSILNNENFETGFTFGISFLDVDVGTNIKLNNRSTEESYNDLLYLPVIGFFNRTRFLENFTLRNYVYLFALKLNKYEGILLDFTLSLEYKIYKHLSLGLSYNALALDMNFDAKKSGNVQYGYRGWILFGSVLF